MSTARRFTGRRALIIALSVGALVCVLAVFLATRAPSTGVVADSALIGRPAPPIAGKTIIGNARFDLAAERGHYVLVDFFASWCAPCTDEAPNLAAFAFSHRKDSHLVIVGVDIEDSSSPAAAFLTRTGASWPAIEDSSGPDSIALAYGVPSPPQLWLIGPNGRALWRVLGAPSSSQLNQLYRDARARFG